MVTELSRFPAASTMAEYRSPPHPPDRRSAVVTPMRLHRNIIGKSSTRPTSLPPNRGDDGERPGCSLHFFDVRQHPRLMGINSWHAPNDGLDRAPLDRAAREILGQQI